jgi:hypothetical protein
MSNIDWAVSNERDVVTPCRLHTKFAPSPRALVRKLNQLAGQGNYRIEMRHDVYNISVSADIDKVIKNLLKPRRLG